MVITPHSLVGALVGARRRSVGSAFAAGVKSHFALDRVPHYDYSLDGLRGKTTAAAELALVAALLRRRGLKATEVAGAVGGIAPDVICLLERHGCLPQLLGPVHDRSHTKRSLSVGPGLLLQAGVVVAALALLGSAERD